MLSELELGKYIIKYENEKQLFSKIFENFYTKNPNLFKDVIDYQNEKNSSYVIVKSKFGFVPYKINLNDQFRSSWYDIVKELRFIYPTEENSKIEINKYGKVIRTEIDGKKGIFVADDTPLSLVCESFNHSVKNGKKRETGKIFAEANEFFLTNWINQNTILKVIKRDDESNNSNTDHNESGYDIITSDLLLTINGKFRSSNLYLETTRRGEGKNKEGKKNGHVRIKIGECDIYLITIPIKNCTYTDLNEFEILAIPESKLEDPKKPGYLINTIPIKILKEFTGRAKEILESEYKNKREKIKD